MLAYCSTLECNVADQIKSNNISFDVGDTETIIDVSYYTEYKI